MVVTSQPLAVDAGLELPGDGGSAVDAAVAAAAVLTVVDPRSTGLGGDLFALCWPAGGDPAPTGLASAGVAPAGLTMDALRDAGHATMPVDGPWSVTVPGAPAGWEALLRALGRAGRDRVLAPATATPKRGFAVSRYVAEEWVSAEAKLRANPVAAALFLPDGQVPVEGKTSRSPSSRGAWSGSLARARRRSTAATSRNGSRPRSRKRAARCGRATSRSGRDPSGSRRSPPRTGA